MGSFANDMDRREREARRNGKRMATERNKADKLGRVTAEQPINIIATRLHIGLGATAASLADAVIDALRDAGWIIVRDDAIKLAQAHARHEPANDNKPTAVPASFGSFQ